MTDRRPADPHAQDPGQAPAPDAPAEGPDAPPASGSEGAGRSGGGAAPAPGGPVRRPDLAGLAAAVRSIERGENPAAPAPRGDASEARRRRREAMAAEAAEMQAREAEEAGRPAPGGPGSADRATPDPPSPEPRPAEEGAAEPEEGEAPPDESRAARPGRVQAAEGEDDQAGERDGARAASGTRAARPGDGTGTAQPDSTRTDDTTDAGRTRPDDARTAQPTNTRAAQPDSTRTEDTADAGRTRPDDTTDAGHARARGSQGGGERPEQQQRARGGPPAATAAAAPAPFAARKAPVDPRAVDAARVALTSGGAPADLAEPVVRLLGEGAAEALRADPWLVLGVPGVRVEQADAFARAVPAGATGPGDERRARALVGHVMERAALEGHTALRAEAVKAALAGYGVPDPDAAVAASVEDGHVLVFRDESVPLPEPRGDDGDVDEDEDTAPVPLLLGLDRYALAEESLADGCLRLLRSFEDDSDAGTWEKAAASAPSASAAQLIRTAAGSGLVLHTGGEAARAEPAALVRAARAAGLRAYAAAYTDNGRRRLAEAVGADAAVTVAGLLAGRGGPGRAPDGSLALDLLAVLDAPQLSAEEAATLVEAVPDGARLVLSGDEFALWSAGPGRAFADLLASKACPRVTSRTPDPGPIGELISYIGAGELAAVDAPAKEVVVVPVHDPAEAVLRTVQLVADSVPRAIGVSADRTQVITLAHGGPAGTRALNAALKERLNPGPGRFGGFDPGDRVVLVTGPGHVLPGTVAGAEQAGLRLELESGGGPGEPVLVPREDVAAAVRHGWALTGHQAAAMRWPAVVVVVPGDAGPLLTRSWVYTAFARGERHLSVVQGADQGLARAVAGPPARLRTTRLSWVLRDLVS
ncbi:helix-hairpin-helix domain-containing protein [Streptomyces sp. HPF1205]|uniref:helix-hairpin-helix domain-containing protein n=1 Tax=Streptomyces sp. HPF1205 TaxID=2873262 RepID=UPI0027E1B1D3|nr:helix-hairpin-helix domain-containing protein [Streptomyces sp. HPF1205]